MEKKRIKECGLHCSDCDGIKYFLAVASLKNFRPGCKAWILDDAVSEEFLFLSGMDTDNWFITSKPFMRKNEKYRVPSTILAPCDVVIEKEVKK